MDIHKIRKSIKREYILKGRPIFVHFQSVNVIFMIILIGACFRANIVHMYVYLIVTTRRIGTDRAEQTVEKFRLRLNELFMKSVLFASAVFRSIRVV